MYNVILNLLVIAFLSVWGLVATVILFHLYLVWCFVCFYLMVRLLSLLTLSSPRCLRLSVRREASHSLGEPNRTGRETKGERQ